MERITVPVGSWDRFLTRNLSIDPGLVGAEHEFVFEDNMVCVSLPSAKDVPLEPCTGERLRYNHYTEIDGKKSPQQLWVKSVDVTVKGTDEVLLPPELLDRHPNQSDLLSKGQQDKLQKLVISLGVVAERSFDLWLRTLRWKCKNSSIGRPEMSGHASGWCTCLTAQPSGHRIWLRGASLTARGSKMVTPVIWEAGRLGGSQPVVLLRRSQDGHGNATHKGGDQSTAVQRLGGRETQKSQRRDHHRKPGVTDPSGSPGQRAKCLAGGEGEYHPDNSADADLSGDPPQS